MADVIITERTALEILKSSVAARIPRQRKGIFAEIIAAKVSGGREVEVPVNVILIGLCFLSAALLTLARSAGPAFALVYLPAVLLLSPVRNLHLPGAPDADPADAAIYGILLAGLLSGRRPRLRATTVDYLVALLICSYAISAITTVGPYRAVSVAGTLLFSYGFLSYFVVRITFQHKAPPKTALALLVVTTFVVCAFGLIEFRLWPRAYADVLIALGLMDPPDDPTALTRFVFYRRLFRANVSFGHPIDLGISAALIFAMIAILAWRSRVDLTRAWVLGGLGLALVACFCAISFSAFMGLGCSLLLFLVLLKFPRSRRLLPALACLLILAGFLFAVRLVSSPVEGVWRGDSSFDVSFRNRQQLIQLSWDTAKRAGLFGFGDRDALPDEINRSVDNSYLLIVMKRGWMTLGLWLALPICLGTLASRGVRRARFRRQAKLILGGFSAVIGTMIAMYTVWFGFVYPQLLMTVLAFTVNEAQAAIHAPRSACRPPGDAQPMSD